MRVASCRSSNSVIPSASARVSPGGTNKPVVPSTTISAGPPTRLAITGRRLAMASITTRPKGSDKLGTATTSANAYHRATSASWPTICVTTSFFSVSCLRKRDSSGPSPTMIKCSGRLRVDAARFAAVIRASRPFSGRKRATAVITSAAAGIERPTRRCAISSSDTARTGGIPCGIWQIRSSRLRSSS